MKRPSKFNTQSIIYRDHISVDKTATPAHALQHCADVTEKVGDNDRSLAPKNRRWHEVNHSLLPWRYDVMHGSEAYIAA